MTASVKATLAMATMTPVARHAMPGFEATQLPARAFGFASSGAYGSGGIAAIAVGGWRRVQVSISGTVVPMATPAVGKSPAGNSAVANSPLHAFAAKPVVKPAALPITTTRHQVTTKDARRGNKGSSPWRFPV
jgi:hypothetical protein